MRRQQAAYLTPEAALEGLARRGFTEQFEVVEGRLRAPGRGETFGPDEVTIREYHRFEGVSDPDDMSIVYAIETRSGTRGTLVDAFGVYSNPAVGTFLRNARVEADPPRAAERRKAG